MQPLKKYLLTALGGLGCLTASAIVLAFNLLDNGLLLLGPILLGSFLALIGTTALYEHYRETGHEVEL